MCAGKLNIPKKMLLLFFTVHLIWLELQCPNWFPMEPLWCQNCSTSPLSTGNYYGLSNLLPEKD